MRSIVTLSLYLLDVVRFRTGRIAVNCAIMSMLNVRFGSFATGSSQQQVGPCPLCPDSDQILHLAEMTRWARSGLMHCNGFMRTGNSFAALTANANLYEAKKLSYLGHLGQKGRSVL